MITENSPITPSQDIRMDEAEQTIVEIIADILGIDAKGLAPTTTMKELGADELDMVEVTMALEHAIDIDFPDGRLLINPNKDTQFSIGDIFKIAAEFY